MVQVGEHASCGPGNLPQSGFSYDPESFMAAGIGVYNFSWRDMGVPDLERMMDIVQVRGFLRLVGWHPAALHLAQQTGVRGSSAVGAWRTAQFGRQSGPVAGVGKFRQ